MANERESDPTQNVISLVQALALSHAALRESDIRYYEARLSHLSGELALRAAHAKEIGDIETKRLDAIRQVDVQARDTTAGRALTEIQTVAKNVAETAETLRKTTSDVVLGLTVRLAALERSDAERSGKGAGVGMSWQVLLGGATLVLAIAAMFKYG